MPLERILVGVDGSDDSRRALAWTAALAERLGAEVVAVHALGLLEQAANRAEVVRRFEEDWCAPLRDVPGLRTRMVVEDGPPSMVVLRVAVQEAVDLVVLGSRGVGGFDELLLGSTSTQVMQHAPVPVTVIPRAAPPVSPSPAPPRP